MFEGMTINRGEWRALADVHEAKMKAIEDEKKRLEGGDSQRECQTLKSHPAAFALSPDSHCLLLLCHFCSSRRRKVKDMHHLLNLQDHRGIYECLSGCVFVQCVYVHEYWFTGEDLVQKSLNYYFYKL